MKSKQVKSNKTNSEIINIPLRDEMQYTGLKVHKIKENVVLTGIAQDGEELCIVMVSGYAEFKINNKEVGLLGNRMSPFEEVPPHAVYITMGDSFELKTTTDSEIAICSAPGLGTYESRVIKPDMSYVEHRGYGQIQRTAKNILPETDPADSLLVVEVITRGGNWSSFPSHRHDEDDLPNQSYLEEIYYHKLNPEEGGFALQRIYNDDKTINDVYVIENNSAVLVKEGYHPVAVPPAYDLYYLNVMAGPVRTWKFYNDPFFEHLIK